MSALDAQIGFGVEAPGAFGTPVTPTRFVEFSSEGIEGEYARIESDGLRPGRLYRSDTRYVPYFAGAAGDVEMEVVSKGFGFFLPHMLGAVSTPVAVDGTFTYVATPAPLTGKSLTCQVGRPFYTETGIPPFSYGGGKVTSWELSNSAGENLVAKLSMDFATETTAIALAIPTYPDVETLSWVGGLVTVGGTQFDVTDASVTGDNAPKADRRYIRRSTAKKEQIGDDYRSGEFSLTADFDSLVQRNRVAALTAAETMAEISMSWRGTTLAGATTFPELRVTIQARLDKFKATVDGPESISQELGGMYLGQSAIAIAYTTTDTTI